MRFPLRLLLLPCLAANVLAGFEEDLASAKGGGPEAVAKVQRDYAKSEANDPAYYILLANYWFRLSQQATITKKPGAETSVGRRGVIEPQIGRQAPDLLAEAVRKFPKRLDIALGLTLCLRKEDRYLDAGKAMLGLLAAYEAPGAMLGQDDQPLPAEQAGGTIAKAAYETASDLFRANTKAASATCEQLALAMTKTFPEDVRAYNLLAALADRNKDAKAALTWLEKAHGIDPSDHIVVINLAEKYLQTGDKTNARTLAQSVLDSPDESARDYQGAAQTILSKASK